MIGLPFGNHCKQCYVEPAIISEKLQSQSSRRRQCGKIRHVLFSHANRFSFRKTSTHLIPTVQLNGGSIILRTNINKKTKDIAARYNWCTVCIHCLVFPLLYPCTGFYVNLFFKFYFIYRAQCRRNIWYCGCELTLKKIFMEWK